MNRFFRADDLRLVVYPAMRILVHLALYALGLVGSISANTLKGQYVFAVFLGLLPALTLLPGLGRRNLFVYPGLLALTVVFLGLFPIFNAMGGPNLSSALYKGTKDVLSYALPALPTAALAVWALSPDRNRGSED